MTEIRVDLADWAVAREGSVLLTVGLGSCVAIALHDGVARIGGLAHILLPSESLARDRRNRAKFPATAVPLLVEQMCRAGAREGRIRAKVVGGATMFAPLLMSAGLHIGERNVHATEAALNGAGIPILACDVGGNHGRSVCFRVSDGRVLVRSLARGDLIL